MKLTELNLTENVNAHLTHLEDLSLFNGKKGAVEAIRFLKNLSTIVKGHSPKKFNITTKWDGSPAIVCGKDPADGKFFVGTKGVFAKSPKLNKSAQDIETNHADVGDNDKSGLRGKLNTALQHLSKLNIENVLQGDLMFTQGDLQERGFENKKYLTFKPNTITYAVPSDSELASKMRSAKIGIVFHTAYEGESLDKMTASFKVCLLYTSPSPRDAS